ncbi:MAG: AraC family transcriptional regulator [Ruminococcus sp.]|nr:AraC family transcriptional regulator [Ruminococcus sp.]
MKANLDYNVINCVCVTKGNRQDNIENEHRQVIRETYVLYYVTSGKGIVTIDGIGFIVKKGQSFLSFPFSNVCLEPYNNGTWSYNWVEFRGLDAAWLVSQTAFSKKNPVTDIIPVENFESFFNISECKSDKTFDQCRASGKLIVLLSYYLEHFPCVSSDTQNYAIAARNYIEKNYRNPDCSVTAVADHIKIDRTYLYRLFKEETGMSVIDYINNCRISKAAILLIDDKISIKDVAYSVGFTDQMYFSKVFKKLKNQTPTEFRKSNKASLF